MKDDSQVAIEMTLACKWIAEKLQRPVSAALRDTEVAVLALDVMGLAPTAARLELLREYVRLRRRQGS